MEATIELEDAVRCALDGSAVLFIGAGLSFLATTRENERIPDGISLIDLLLEQPLGTGSKHPLDRVAGHVIRQKGVEFIYDLLEKNLLVKSVDEKLVKLYDLPWRRIYTTNYDDAIEVAIKGRRPVSSLTLNNDTSSAGPGSIVHLNGYIREVSPANLQKGLVFTDYSYATSRLLGSDWFKFLLRDLRSARAVIFVGYSLADLDIQRLLISDRSLSAKCFFFISPKADALEIDAISEYGRLVPGGVETLVSNIQSVSADYPEVRFSSAFLCLTEVSAGSVVENSDTRVKKLTDQLVYGRLPEAEVLRNEKLFGNQPYLVFRKQDKEAIEAIRKGPWRDLYI